MRIDAGLDTGDILMQREIAIRQEDTAETLAPRLADLGADLMVETLRGLDEGKLDPVPQDDSKASLAPILKKEDGLVDFQRSAVEIWNRLRGFQPWPGAYTFFRGKHLQVHSARPLDTRSQGVAGELRAADNALLVVCGAGTTLELLELQIEGKKRMSARDFLNGYRPAGERLGS
jgi:methionyl-tRNA formyltransferase